ncbi:uncharacterized protein LOC118736394 [Rhagoletis pomonella]|uniref:uncharacterized protein LOC118736394 n=1 Tax=Rhagoletis pomonella TaxID=28610 RepID=UPI00177BEB0B|nr:uncharacterized protein LOC118736394 [Rhagoletis pomonella]
MPLSLLHSLIGIFAVWISKTPSMAEGLLAVNSAIDLPLIENASDILCSFHTKVVYVYFENKTSSGYSGDILRDLSDCGTSYITLRNRVKTKPLELINNDGILLYLVMIFHDASQRIDPSIIQKYSAAKHLSHVMMLIVNSETVTEAWLRHTFAIFWHIWFLNVVIMFQRNNELHVYRYNPFTDEFLIKLELSSGMLPRKDDLFPPKLPDMGGKPLSVCLYQDEVRAIFEDDDDDQKVIGSDGFMSAFIAERLNATRVIHRVSRFGNFMLRADICFKEITHELDDVAFNTRFLAAPTFARQVEYTIVHSRDDLCVLVPKARIATIFWNLFRSFTIPVWLTILLSIPLAYIFCNLVHLRLHKCDFDLLQLYATTLSMPLTRIPARTPLRIFLFCWLFYGMLICNAFKGNLTSSLVFRTYQPDLNTIKDLAESPYDMLTYSRHSKHLERFLNISDPYEATIKRKSIVAPDEQIVAKVRENNLSYAYLQKFHFATFHANARMHSHRGRPLYHVMSTCLVPFHAVYIVPYGSPYLGFINRLIRSSIEFGYAVHWESIMNAAFIESGKKNIRNPMNDDDPVVLKLFHFQAAFFLLFLGLKLAFLTFLWEIFKHRSPGYDLKKARVRVIHSPAKSAHN